MSSIWPIWRRTGAKLGVDKELYTIDLKTRDNRRFIGYTKNGVRQNYVSEIELASDNLENVRYMSQAFEKAVQPVRNPGKARCQRLANKPGWTGFRSNFLRNPVKKNRLRIHWRLKMAPVI